MAQQDQAGWWSLAVELTEKRLQQLRRPGVLSVPWIVGAIAVIAATSVEEHLHAGLIALLDEPDDIGVLDRADIDALARGDVGQRLQTIPNHRCLLEFQSLRRSIHLGLEAGLNGAALAREEFPRLLDQLGVVVGLYPPHARRRATLDLILQAGSRSVGEDAVGA